MMMKFQQLLKELKEMRDDAANSVLVETDTEKWNLRCQQMKEQMVTISQSYDSFKCQSFQFALTYYTANFSWLWEG